MDSCVKIDQELLDALSKADRLYIVAAGTSYHAGLVGKELFDLGRSFQCHLFHQLILASR